MDLRLHMGEDLPLFIDNDMRQDGIPHLYDWSVCLVAHKR
jgi:hypothetical protein